MRLGADHDKEAVGGNSFSVSGCSVTQRELSQLMIPGAVHYLSVEANGDAGGCVDRADEVVRHGLLQGCAVNYERDL